MAANCRSVYVELSHFHPPLPQKHPTPDRLQTLPFDDRRRDSASILWGAGEHRLLAPSMDLRMEITEALLEMHFHRAILAAFEGVFGARFLRLLKPSPQREAW